MTREQVGEVRADVPGPVTHPRSVVLAAIGLACAALAVNGLGRFAYALVLPAMREDLHWTYAVAGSLNTASAIGYLAGALITAPVAAWLGQRWALALSVVISSISVLAAALTPDATILLALRAIGGITGAVAFIVAGALVAGLTASGPGNGGQSRHTAALLLGIYSCGPGLGIALSGISVPPVLVIGGWRLAWVVVGILCLACCVIAILSARRVPARQPLRASGGAGDSRDRMPARPILFLLISYGLYGAGYIAYMTFVIALLRTYHYSDTAVAVFWLLIGIAAVVGAVGWMPVLGRLPTGVSTALILAVTALGAALPLISSRPFAIFGSAILFGYAFLHVVTAMTSGARTTLPRPHWATAIAVLTVAFAAGQCLGPVFAGVLSDYAGGVRLGIGAGAALIGIATVLALFHRTPPAQPESAE